MSSRGLNQLGSSALDFEKKGGFPDLLDGLFVEKYFFDRDNSMSLVKLPIEERNCSVHLVSLDLVFGWSIVHMYSLMVPSTSFCLSYTLEVATVALN